MSKDENTVEDFLKIIEFPGADEESIDDYLKRNNISAKVMIKIRKNTRNSWFFLFWTALTLINIALLVLLGSTCAENSI